MNKRFLVFLSSRKSWTLPYIIFSVIFVIIPLVLIVVYAFTDDNGHLTFANFQKFFEHPEAINTFVYSIGIAIITTLICILLGYPAAWIFSNSKLNHSKTMVVLFILPMWVNINAPSPNGTLKKSNKATVARVRTRIFTHIGRINSTTIVLEWFSLLLLNIHADR